MRVMFVRLFGTKIRPPTMSTTPVQLREVPTLSSPGTVSNPPVMRMVPCEREVRNPACPTCMALEYIKPPLMFSEAMFVRPTRVTTLTLVLADDSRAMMEPLSRVTSPAQMLKATPAPAKTLVTTRDELVI